MDNQTSVNKLGIFGKVLAVPMAPEAAQMRQGYLHVRLVGGAYLSGGAPIAPSRLKEVATAYKAAAAAGTVEPTYSGSGSKYVPLSVAPVEGLTGVYALLLPEGIEVCRVLVDPSVAITSSDESLKSQVTGGNDSDDDSDE